MCPDDIQRLNTALIEFFEKMSSWENAVVKSSGLSPQQNHTIEIIGHAGSLRMKPLAEKLGVTTGTLTVMVNRLERLGLVERHADPTDGRVSNINLTPRGLDIHREHHAHHHALAEGIACILDKETRLQFGEILVRLNRNLFNADSL